MRRAGNAQDVLGSFGRSRAPSIQPSDRVTFDDVAGIDEAKAELCEIVDFLKQPEKYRRLGARVPRGVLLAARRAPARRCLRGRSRARRTCRSSRMRGVRVHRGDRRRRRLACPRPVRTGQGGRAGDRLHRRARRDRALADLRRRRLRRRRDEREQTLNQILTEMDGFDSDDDVIVIAATNRPDVLDAALSAAGPLRPPHRRDHPISTGAGDPQGSHAGHSARDRCRPGPDRRDDAGHGRRGSANLVNEAALSGARTTMPSKRPTSGRARADPARCRAPGDDDREDRRRTAYHEAGHALVGHAHRRRRSGSQGVDHPARHRARCDVRRARDRPLQLPRARAYAKIKVALGGRAAEEVVFGEMSTGAESDMSS